MLKCDSIADKLCKQMCCFACLFDTRVRDTQSHLADNLSADTLRCPTAQSSALPAGDAGAAAEDRLPSGGREDERAQ